MRDHSGPSTVASISLSDYNPFSEDFKGWENAGKGLLFGAGAPFVDDAMGNATIAGAPSPAQYGMVWDDAQKRWVKVDEMIGAQKGDLAHDREFVENYGGTGPIRNVTPITPRDIPYEDVAAPRDVQAHTVGPAERYTPGRIAAVDDVTAPEFDPLSRVQGRGYDAEEIGPMTRIGPVSVGRAAIDTGQANQMKGDERASIRELQRVASGAGPSAAEEELKGAMAESAQQQMAMAASARGAQRAGAMREATIAAGEGAFKAAKAAAAAKAAEQATARGQLSAAISNARGADIQLAAKSADLEQQANDLQGQIDAAKARGDADAANRLALSQADLRTRAKEFGAAAGNRAEEVNAGAANRRASEKAGLTFEAATGNANRSQQRNITQSQLDTEAGLQGAHEANVINTHNADLLTGTDEHNVDRSTGVQVGNANRRSTADLHAADLAMEGDKFTQDLGVRRDVAESDRKRGDFVAGAGARSGLRGTGVQLTELTAQEAAQMTNEQLAILSAQGNAAATAEIARRRAQAGALALGAKIGGAVMGNPSALLSGGGAGGGDDQPTYAPVPVF